MLKDVVGKVIFHNKCIYFKRRALNSDGSNRLNLAKILQNNKMHNCILNKMIKYKW